MTAKPTRSKILVGALSTMLMGAMVGYGVHAIAEGAPTMQPLYYGGLVTSDSGTPLDGMHAVSVSIFSASTGGTAVCSTPALSATFTEGRFRIALSSGDNGCTQAVANNPDTWVELTVDGSTFPRSKIGAMPYAIEAEHAKSATAATTASSVTGAQAQTLTQLSASVSALQTTVAALPTTPSTPASPTLKFRFINVGNGCTWNPPDNATVCNCNRGEIILAAGGYAPGGMIQASRAQNGPSSTVGDADRASQWTISCVQLNGSPMACTEVQALCLSN